MTGYHRNKIKTFWQIIQRIDNWPTALAMRLNRRQRGLRMLNFHGGPVVICRSGTREWDVIHEILFAGGYGNALEYLKKLPGNPLVLDCGANIGLFSLLAMRHHPTATIHAFEPGPPNYRLFEMNRLANPDVSNRIQLHKEAIGGETRKARWHFDEDNPGASNLYTGIDQGFDVQIRSLTDVLQALPSEIDLLKLDIEGAEYEVLAATPAEIWRRIRAISLELHHDPAGKISQGEFLNQMRKLGFQIASERVCSFFLRR